MQRPISAVFSAALPAVITFLIGAPSLTAKASTAALSGNQIELPMKALLAPATGFEEKNNVQVVLYGSLPNSCYTLAEHRVERINEFNFRVRQFAIQATDGICADVNQLPEHMRLSVPFTEEVALGRLAPGDYQIYFYQLNVGEKSRALNVAKNTTPAVDSLPYAAVSNVQAPDRINGIDTMKVTISGVLNSTCTAINDQVKVMDEDDVYVLLPTIRKLENVKCEEALIPFDKTVDLGRPPHPGIYLIHTRSMNGKALNKIINVMK